MIRTSEAIEATSAIATAAGIRNTLGSTVSKICRTAEIIDKARAALNEAQDMLDAGLHDALRALEDAGLAGPGATR